MSDKVKLKACPFCGGKDVVVVICEGDDDYAQLRCDNCLAAGPIKDQIGDWRRPHAEWNHRPVESALLEALEKLEKHVCSLCPSSVIKNCECQNIIDARAALKTAKGGE